MTTVSRGFQMFIVCDSLRHERAKAVTNFLHLGDGADDRHYGRWDERWTRGSSNGERSSSVTRLLEDEHLAERWTRQGQRDRPSAAIRTAYVLRCRSGCAPSPLELREETLFGVLTRAGGAGVSVLSLSAISAILRSKPEL